MTQIELATVLLGATAFSVGNVNGTYRGQVLLSDKSVRNSIIKDLNLIQLCNELVAHCLARHVGLPVPDSFIGLARPDILPVKLAPVLPDGGRLVFVSADVKVPNVTFHLNNNPIGAKVLLREIAMWADLGRLFAFDAWIANIDRHPGNLLFGNSGSFWLIDHGHCFGGPNWKPEDLNADNEYANRLSEWMTPELDDAQRKERTQQVAAFEALVRDFDAASTAEKSHIDHLLPMESVSLLKGFIEQRAGSIVRHASKALGVPVIV